MKTKLQAAFYAPFPATVNSMRPGLLPAPES